MLSAKDGKVSTIEKIENGIIKTDKLELWQESLFPIIPSVSYSFKF